MTISISGRGGRDAPGARGRLIGDVRGARGLGVQQTGVQQTGVQQTGVQQTGGASVHVRAERRRRAAARALRGVLPVAPVERERGESEQRSGAAPRRLRVRAGAGAARRRAGRLYRNRRTRRGPPSGDPTGAASDARARLPADARLDPRAVRRVPPERGAQSRAAREPALVRPPPPGAPRGDRGVARGSLGGGGGGRTMPSAKQRRIPAPRSIPAAASRDDAGDERGYAAQRAQREHVPHAAAERAERHGISPRGGARGPREARAGPEDHDRARSRRTTRRRRRRRRGFQGAAARASGDEARAPAAGDYSVVDSRVAADRFFDGRPALVARRRTAAFVERRRRSWRCARARRSGAVRSR